MAHHPGVNLIRSSSDEVTKSQLFPILTMAPQLVGEGFLVPAIATVIFGFGADVALASQYGVLGLGCVFAVYFALLSFFLVYELRIGSNRIPLRLGVRLTAADLAQHSLAVAADTPFAEVTHSPQSPRILGIKNLSSMPWRAALPDRTRVEILPGHSLRLVGQCRIRFGKVEGVVA